jgi:hypothetical protein
MDIKHRTVLVLGGGGLVGSAICRKLVEEGPKRIIVTALVRSEAQEAVAALRKEFPQKPASYFVPWWGNIFVRHDLKDMKREEILNDPHLRAELVEDMLDELNEAVLERTTLYRLLKAHKPDVIIDGINSATAIAYQDIFQTARGLLQTLNNGGGTTAAVKESAERLLCTLYVPQLIRHVQILYRSMHKFKTTIYVKIGTSGTGGMGLNIPYTHSEERPSSVLLSKSSVAGAHTLLLFLMGRTPDAPITKEIKPTAAIAWKRVAYGEIKKRGKPIELFDCPPAKGMKLGKTLPLAMKNFATPMHDTLKSVFIDTGENGLFSRGEFEAISTPGQMEFVTPEEIADDVIYEIKGGNTGRDIINALDNATLSPTYRAGYLFQSANNQIIELEKKHKVDSVAFEMLGPPRLSKLLYEAYLLKLTCGSITAAARQNPAALSKRLARLVTTNKKLRVQIISIGIPILMPDGKTLVRGNTMKIPAVQGATSVPVTPTSLEHWAHDGWVDLRPANMKRWVGRLKNIMKTANAIPGDCTGSRYLNDRKFWNDFHDIDPGKIAGWIFSYEEKGMRMKA